MHNKVRLSKRQIKEDKFTSFMLTSKSYVQENWQFVVIGFAVVILVISSIIYYTNTISQESSEASTRYARATAEYRSGNVQVAKLSLSQIIDDFSDTDVAEDATYMLGKLNLESRSYVEAISNFQTYLAKYKNDKLKRSAVYAGLGTCYENQAQYEQALTNFRAAYDEYPDGPLGGDYLFRALINQLELGQKEPAKSTLALIEEKFPGTDLLSKAIIRFQEKGLK